MCYLPKFMTNRMSVKSIRVLPINFSLLILFLFYAIHFEIFINADSTFLLPRVLV